jgi:hypothetical protein
MNEVRPGAWLLLGGGIVLAISAFLPWFDFGMSDGGLSTSITGIQGVFVLLIGLLIAGYGGVEAFSGESLNLPDEIGPVSVGSLVFTLGVAAFLITFGLQFRDNPGIGVTLGWIASAAATVGAVLEARDGDGFSSGPSGPPPQRF